MMSSNALARLGEEEGKCWAFGESCRVVPAEVAREVVVALQAERDALAAKLAELDGQEPVAWMGFGPRDGRAEFSIKKPAGSVMRDFNMRPVFARPAPAEPVNARLLDALRSIQRYGLDTLSGRADGGDDDRAWQRAAVNEMTKRARIALSAAEAQQAEPVRPKVSFIPSVENMPMARSIDDEMMDLVDRLGALEPVDPRAWKHLLVYAPKTDPVRLTRVDIEKAFAQAGLKPEDYREDGEILPLVIAIESATLRKNGIEVAE